MKKIQSWKIARWPETANPVLGEGNPQAKVMFIGEAPGQKEDELKRPFVGAAAWQVSLMNCLAYHQS